MVASGGTLFIERERKRDALRVVHQVAEALRGGEIVAVFPEGTTSDGRALLPFHANLLQAAIATEVPVQPLALRYCDNTQPVSDAAAYVGEMTLAESIWRIVRAHKLTVRVHVLAPEGTRHLDRRALAARLEEQIASVLDQPLA
jgi:1-acyl-sn-glycerol-3-phosphate acyltransferase